MEAAIQASSTLSGKINVVNDLINIKVHAPSNIDFSPEVSEGSKSTVINLYNYISSMVCMHVAKYSEFCCKLAEWENNFNP